MPYLHHTLIHFPVALSLVAALCALVALVRPDAFWVDAQRRLTYATALAASISATTGLLSAGHVIEGGVPEATVALHRNIALAGTGLVVLAALVGFIGYRRDSVGLARASQLGVLVAAAAIGGGAHLGGDMLHPGMAPWSNKPHSHGTAAPHGHGGAEPADDHGHDHDHDHDETDAGEHAGMAMPTVDAEAGDAGNAAPPPAADASAAGTADARAPAPGTGHVHQHGAGGQDLPRAPGARTPAPASTPEPPPTAPPAPVAPAPPAGTGMPPGHKM